MGMHKSALIGMFLSILELVRHHGVHAHQVGVGGDIWLERGEMFRDDIDLSNVDQYDGKQVVSEDLPTKMR
jgi:segregation and condensation protein A